MSALKLGKEGGFLMIIQLTIVSALAAATGVGIISHRRRQESKRRGQLLMQGLHQAIAAEPLSRHLISGRQSEMEALLAAVRAAADALVAALEAEKERGRVYEADPEDASLFEDWTESRRANEQAHEAYNQAVQEYRDFVQSLAPPQQAEATERGYSAMGLARA
jgi:hypothetical protein